MAELKWDQPGERQYETGVDHGVLYLHDQLGVYDTGYAWNGLVSVTESPSGAESTPQYADNIKYLNLQSAEEFGATVEAFTYPDEFARCDGSASPEDGIVIGQQGRESFGLAYRTKVGNDLTSNAGFKLHLVYNAQAAPSEKAYTTVNDSPEAITFSWELTTTPIEVGTIEGIEYSPTASLTIDSRKVDADALDDLMEVLYGSPGQDPRLPTPAEVVAMFAGTVTEVTPTAPAYNTSTHVLTIPTVTGVQYKIGGVVQTPGNKTLTADTMVTANATAGYKLATGVDDDWFYDYV